MNEDSQAKPIVLDSWAVIAWLQGEAQGDVVRDLIGWIEGDREAKERANSFIGQEVQEVNLFLNIINLGEVFYILGRRKGKSEAQATINELMATPMEIISIPNSLVFKAASLKIKYTIAYADAFAVASAKVQNASLMTGDPELKNLDEIPIMWIGEREKSEAGGVALE